MRDRSWLRTFLRLDMCSGGAIPERDIRRQEDSVLQVLHLFGEQPGVVLADEVGMGKTYEAIGVLAAALQEDPQRRALILTPGPDLNMKWEKELRAFGDPNRPMYRGFQGRFRTAARLGELVEAARTYPIVVAPVNVFASGRAGHDHAYLLSLWCEHRGLRGNQAAALFRQYRGGEHSRLDLTHERFLGEIEWQHVAPNIDSVLDAHRQASPSLDRIFDEGGYPGFANTALVDRALADLRFRLAGSLIPQVYLLIVDEAHKLKNPAALRAMGVRTAFAQRFDKALFLTATPFQLTVEELAQVFELFALSRTAPPDLRDRAARLLSDIRAYQTAYADFERVWNRLNEESGAAFGALFQTDPALLTIPSDPSLRVVVEQARRLLTLKRERIEPGFRSWMIRSLRDDKRIYRQQKRERLVADGGHGVPFILYERFIAELFRTRSRTHKAAVQINMVSSFGAAREGAILSNELREGLVPETEAYRSLLREVLQGLKDEQGGHPKLRFVVNSTLERAERGDKTLIFCSRVETLRELRREIDRAWMSRLVERWRRAYPSATEATLFDGHHPRLQERFQGANYALYLALRERYVPALLNSGEFALAHLSAIVGKANAELANQRLTGSHAERVDWSILKRCVEHAAALFLRDSGQIVEGTEEALDRLCNPQYVVLGYDLVKDDLEEHCVGDRPPTWRISEEDAELVLSPRPHLWTFLQGPLLDVPADLRVRTVERLARYLTFKEVPFLADLLFAASRAGLDIEHLESRALLRFTDGFWTTPEGRPWCDLLRRYLTYAASLDSGRSRDILDSAVAAGHFVRHTVEGESRERLREAFNTPLYPMVLVANEVMQEGLDLHHHCAHVVHHDLAWNPAQLEQRVGRVDRLGSLIQRRRARDPKASLDILLPVIAQTIDERLERTVRMRERWLEFLLGAPPDLKEHGLADHPSLALPPSFAEALRIELGPKPDDMVLRPPT